ncbi:MAG: GlsB/YeaQ/YmgE family stress response membrane protein [Acidimicrobiia bacterium]
MGIIAWIIFGGLAGWVASLIMKTDGEQGLVANVIVGIIGAFIGGFLMHVIGNETSFGFNLGSFLVAVLGAVILLFVYKALTGRR